MRNYATVDCVLQELKFAKINRFHVDEVLAYFGKYDDLWATYLCLFDEQARYVGPEVND